MLALGTGKCLVVLCVDELECGALRKLTVVKTHWGSFGECRQTTDLLIGQPTSKQDPKRSIQNSNHIPSEATRPAVAAVVAAVTTAVAAATKQREEITDYPTTAVTSSKQTTTLSERVNRKDTSGDTPEPRTE